MHWGHEEWHIMGDVLKVLEVPLGSDHIEFKTMDGILHKVKKWDMILAFPPCTNLAVSGARYFEKKRADGRQRAGIEFFCKFLTADCDKVLIENPVNIISGDYIKKWFPDLAEKYGLPIKPTQIIQPWQFGHDASKKTCLWLKGLPKLVPTKIVEPDENGRYANQTKDGQNKILVDGKWIGFSNPLTPIIRSKTYSGVAEAIATQYTNTDKLLTNITD